MSERSIIIVFPSGIPQCTKVPLALSADGQTQNF